MKFRYITMIIAGCSIFYCCTKVAEGFLSDRLFYRANPFGAVKGRVSTSVPLETDGSTQPLTVKLLAIRNSAGQPADLLQQEFEIAVYKAEMRSIDTTLAALEERLGTAMSKPFNVNPVGGRLEVTPASVYADTGTYEFDLEVSNVKGKKVLNQVGKLRLTDPVPFQITRRFANTSVPGQEATFVTNSAFDVTVQRVPGPNKIIVKFVDKNGVIFNPLAGEVVSRVSIPTNLRFQFRQFAPYYAEEKTDTALVFEYPEKVPTFPLYTLNNAYTASYRIPSAFNDLNLNINPEFGVRLYPFDVPFVSGTWIITNKINFASRL